MNRHKRLITGLIITLLISTSGFVYGKNVQAAKLENELQTALRSDNYENAKLIHEKVNSDIVITKLFSFNEKAENLTKSQFETLKTSYLNDSISYEELNTKLSSLYELNTFDTDDNERQTFERIESFREAYRMAEKQFNEQNYTDAFATLKEVESYIDAAYKNRVHDLVLTINHTVAKEIDIPLNNYINKMSYSEAMSLLDENKELLPQDFFEEKTNEINELIETRKKAAEDKKKEAEDKKKLAQEEARKKSEAKLAVYLDGYIPNPSKENIVSAMASKTQFLVWVDIPSQTTNVFVGNKGNWKLIRSFISSTGSSGSDTPTGTYTIKDRGKWFFSEKYQQGAQYWVRFIGNYLFHSLPMDQSRQVVDPTLGTPASHGCVRLSIDDAAWFYNNIPTGTTVYIK
jgi:lipoprotein-anchoring transpeptidase ErfK/SrfK